MSPQSQRDFVRHLRKSQTEAETSLWASIRRRQLDGFRFRRQAPIGPYVADFVCFEVKLVVELDGKQHYETDVIEYDERRTAWLQAQGFRVLRFRNAEVLEDFHAVRTAIIGALQERAKD